MCSWMLCLLLALAVAVVPSSSWTEASSSDAAAPSSNEASAPAPASPVQQVLAAAPQPAADVIPGPFLLCGPTCGRFNGLVSALLLAVYNLLLALLGTVNTALAFTLYLVYLLLCIIQVTVSSDISIAVSGLILLLQRLAVLPGLGGLLQTIGLLLTGLLGCLLRVLGVVLPL